MCSWVECCVVISWGGQPLTPSQASKHRNCSPSCEVAASSQHKERLLQNSSRIFFCIFSWIYRISWTIELDALHHFIPLASPPCHEEGFATCASVAKHPRPSELVVLQDGSKVVRTVLSGMNNPNPSNLGGWSLVQSTNLWNAPIWSKHVITIGNTLIVEWSVGWSGYNWNFKKWHSVGSDTIICFNSRLENDRHNGRVAGRPYSSTSLDLSVSQDVSLMNVINLH